MTAETGTFMTSDRCAMCHDTSVTALRDAAGRDVAQFALWRGSMMALSARDPYWLAVFAEERARHPEQADAIDETCTRCHAPAGAHERKLAGDQLRFDDIVAGTSPEAIVARDGVTCTACHQITPTGLGTEASFTGNYQIGTQRQIFGPHDNPFVMPMFRHTGYTPTAAGHVDDAELCATCHTVIIGGRDGAPEVVEQAPYLEWRNSDFRTGGPREASCTACHAPTIDEDGAPIVTPISTMPMSLTPRAPVARHVFAGANATMLRAMAAAADWTGAGVDPAELAAAADRAEATLRSGIAIELSAITRTPVGVRFDVAIENHAGHKYPTGYPNRRAWLHIKVFDGADAIVFESGATDARGALLGAGGARLDAPGTVLPHRDRVTSADHVAVWEAILGDRDGRPEHLPLDATGFLKDNRLLPAGWTSAHPDAARIGPVGTGGDPDFTAGGDVVHVEVTAPGARRIEVAVEFQTVSAATLDRFAAGTTAASARFTSIMGAVSTTGSTIATATAVISPAR